MKHEADYLLEHNMIPREEMIRVFSESDSASVEIDSSFLCFGDEYRHLSEILPKDTVIIDLGCAYNPQAYYFKDFDRTISVDLSFGNNVRFQPKNNEIFIESIQHFIKETLPTLHLDLEKCFAICSYVPDEEAQKMVAETFPYHSVIYCDDVISKQLPKYVNVSEVLNRAKELIKAYTDMCDGRNYGNLLSESTTYYDGCDCDSTCLKDDMESLLDDIEDVLLEISTDKDNTDYDDIEPDML